MIPYLIHQTAYFVEVLIEGLFFFEMLLLDVWVIEQLPNNASSKSDVLTPNLHIFFSGRNTVSSVTCQD